MLKKLLAMNVTSWPYEKLAHEVQGRDIFRRNQKSIKEIKRRIKNKVIGFEDDKVIIIPVHFLVS